MLLIHVISSALLSSSSMAKLPVKTFTPLIEINQQAPKSTININGIEYTFEKTMCVHQKSKDTHLLTFKATNDALDYTLTVVLGAIKKDIIEGEYLFYEEERTEYFAVITLVTQNGTFVNNGSGSVTYTKTENTNHASLSILELEDNKQELSPIAVSFKISCTDK